MDVRSTWIALSMVDSLTKLERSRRMSLVRSVDTKPERRVRSLLHSNGYRYRLHVRELPGTPDLVFPTRKKLIFVHGCFWHQHRCKLGHRIPKSRVAFWTTKLGGNRNRDKRIRYKLQRLGWKILVVWECQLQKYDDTRLLGVLKGFLDG